MICDGCGENADHLKYRTTERKSFCGKCWVANGDYRAVPFFKEFEPYALTNGPKHLIPLDDPNRVPWYTKEGKRVVDNEKIMIQNRSDEKKYLEMMGAHQAEKGEKLMGIEAEFKDRHRGRIYSFPKKSCSSS